MLKHAWLPSHSPPPLEEVGVLYKVEQNVNHFFSRNTNWHLFTNPELRPFLHTVPNIRQSRWTWPISERRRRGSSDVLLNSDIEKQIESVGGGCNHTESELHHLSNDGCIGRQQRIKWHNGGCAHKVRRVRGDTIKKDQSGWRVWSLNRKQKLSHSSILKCESCGAQRSEAAKLLLTHTVVAWQKKHNKKKKKNLQQRSQKLGLIKNNELHVLAVWAPGVVKHRWGETHCHVTSTKFQVVTQSHQASG